MSLQLTPEQLEEYRQTARQRWQARQQEVDVRRQRAWQSARRAAALLKQEYAATRVVAFGSLTREDCFTPWSDVDIAAWGLRPQATFRAIDAVLALDKDIEVNLVDVATCRPAMLAAIEKEGIDLW